MKPILSVQQFKSRKDWEEYVWEKLTTGLAKATSARDIKTSLATLITAYEKKQIIKRAAAVSFLKQGKTYRKIGDLLWLSHPTISAIKKSMRAGEGYVSYYGRNKINEKLKKGDADKKGSQFGFSALLDALFKLPPPPPRRPPRKGIILPHGKLVYPQRRR